jgi:ATP/maltotriose-dependent transcriptional regulator MalT
MARKIAAMSAGVGDVLEAAREAFKRRDWVAAREAFRQARTDGKTLSADDVYSASDAAWWLGLIDESLTAAEEAFKLYVGEHRPRQAANAALGIAYTLSLRGDEAIASAWAGRGLRLLQDQPEHVEHGYLAYMDLEGALTSSDLDRAIELARRIGDMGRRFESPDLVALAALGEGRALVKQGRVDAGMRLLDEAMLAAVSDELEPAWAGNIYCHLMAACEELMDLRRAAEWTHATARWCERMPGAGPFMGICRVHRCQVLQLGGAWAEAEREMQRVCDELAHFHVSIVAEAHYRLGEVRRLRGDLSGAEAALRQAHQLGREPQPGFALLRLAQGRVDAALSSIQTALASAGSNRLSRARFCAAMVDIALAAGDVSRAAAASAELDEAAATYGSSGLSATALHARGAVLLHRGEVGQAYATLREALVAWQKAQAPYESARVRLLLARALDQLGDRDAAELERDAAQSALLELGVSAESAVARNGTPKQVSRPDGLTPRECEVLRLAGQGMANAEIAERLVLSVRTVERHLATVYQKLDLHGRNARAAAVSYALRESVPTT